jgi:adiponectin receptor
MDRAKRGMDAVVDAKDKLAESIERAIIAARERRLITYEELPVPWRVNPHILQGYRFTETKVECVRSAFCSFSNETCNIWTHGLGFLMVLAIAFYFYPTSQIFAYHTTADKLINGLFFLAAGKALVSFVWSDCTLRQLTIYSCVAPSGILSPLFQSKLLWNASPVLITLESLC